MKLALTHPTLGFYRNSNVIGKDQSHFITSPEINQVFGELIGIWCVTQWEQFGKPKKMQLVELGPGRGTLMKDLLRAAHHFPGFYNGLDIHLVEMSPGMRSKQKYALDCKPLDTPEPPDVVTGKEHMKLRGPANLDVCCIVIIQFRYTGIIQSLQFLMIIPLLFWVMNSLMLSPFKSSNIQKRDGERSWWISKEMLIGL